jgi:hypothetical protein
LVVVESLLCGGGDELCVAGLLVPVIVFLLVNVLVVLLLIGEVVLDPSGLFTPVGLLSVRLVQ